VSGFTVDVGQSASLMSEYGGKDLLAHPIAGVQIMIDPHPLGALSSMDDRQPMA